MDDNGQVTGCLWVILSFATLAVGLALGSEGIVGVAVVSLVFALIATALEGL